MGAGEANDAPLAAVGSLHEPLHWLGLPEIEPVVGALDLDPGSEGASRVQVHSPPFCIPNLGRLALQGVPGHEFPSRPRVPVVVADQAEGGGVGACREGRVQ